MHAKARAPATLLRMRALDRMLAKDKVFSNCRKPNATLLKQSWKRSNQRRVDVNTIVGFGLGLRPTHYQALLAQPCRRIDWLEALTENYLEVGGAPRAHLRAIAERYPLVLHGVSLSIGSWDPLDVSYLRSLRSLAREIQAAWISDHLCWTGVDGVNLHDLLPLPFTEEALSHVSERISHAQELLGMPLLIENVSSYIQFEHNEMTEWEFLCELSRRTGCELLLDINNVYVSSVNHGFDPVTYLRALPRQRVRQIHLAGHSAQGAFLIDTHDAPVNEAVWSLFELSMALFGPVPTMIERDANIPPLDELLIELDRARRLSAHALRQAS